MGTGKSAEECTCRINENAQHNFILGIFHLPEFSIVENDFIFLFSANSLL
jgi:hypothetical protein